MPSVQRRKVKGRESGLRQGSSDGKRYSALVNVRQPETSCTEQPPQAVGHIEWFVSDCGKTEEKAKKRQKTVLHRGTLLETLTSGLS